MTRWTIFFVDALGNVTGVALQGGAVFTLADLIANSVPGNLIVKETIAPGLLGVGWVTTLEKYTYNGSNAH